MARWRQTFTVEGTTGFPIDMLRYDRCSPSTSEDAVTIESTLRRENDGPQLVTLVREVEFKGVEPTEGRWSSFGWHVREVETHKN